MLHCLVKPYLHMSIFIFARHVDLCFVMCHYEMMLNGFMIFNRLIVEALPKSIAVCKINCTFYSHIFYL